MTKEQGTAIVMLLSVIAAVMLVGREQVVSNIQTLFWAGLVLGIIALIGWGIFAAIRGTIREIKKAREEEDLSKTQWFAIAMVVLNGALVVWSETQHVKLDSIPFYWLPIALFLASLVLLGIQSVMARRRREKETGVREDHDVLGEAILQARHEREEARRQKDPDGAELLGKDRRKVQGRQEPRFD